MEVEDFVRYVNSAASEDEPADDVVQGGEITVEQYEEMVGRMKADADLHGRVRPLG